MGYFVTVEDGVADISATSGAMTLAISLDYETKALYLLHVLAVELPRAGVPQLNVSGLGYIVVGDGNEAPVFTSASVGFVSENLARGTVIFNVTVSEEFNPRDGAEFAIIGGTFAPFFSIGRTTGRVATTAIFDFERAANLVGTLVITVRDRGRGLN